MCICVYIYIYIYTHAVIIRSISIHIIKAQDACRCHGFIRHACAFFTTALAAVGHSSSVLDFRSTTDARLVVPFWCHLLQYGHRLGSQGEVSRVCTAKSQQICHVGSTEKLQDPRPDLPNSRDGRWGSFLLCQGGS